MNNKTVSFTDCEVLEKLKTQEKEKIAVEDTKKAKQFEVQLPLERVLALWK